MATYSLELKEKLVRKMMPPHSERIAELSAQYGISRATLYNWRNQYRAKGHIVPNRKTSADKWDAKTKLAVVIKTAAMNHAERAEYCRANGLYVEQLDEWREAFEAMGQEPDIKSKRALSNRVLRDHNLQHYRGRSKPPQKPSLPVSLHASCPNQVRSWDITFLPSSIRGRFYRLYMVMDIYSRYIVGWEVHLRESAQHASELIEKASIRQGIHSEQLVLHADNGSPIFPKINY